jgi:nitroimidazol reductase NimA-like FMN-containing flavoprotein (pyridoxamine 5'-phosphate oxidase superfamily)
MSTETWFQGQLRDLSQEECLELLASKSVGRIAYDGPDGPEVLPLNFVVQDGSVLFRTSPYSELGRRLRLDVAAFQVDEVDDYTQSGWSVLLRGPIEPVEPDDLPPADLRPTAWPAGRRSLHLRLQPRTITGRRLLAG